MDNGTTDLVARLTARVRDFEASAPKESSDGLAGRVRQKIAYLEDRVRGVESELVNLMAAKVITEDEAVILFDASFVLATLSQPAYELEL